MSDASVPGTGAGPGGPVPGGIPGEGGEPSEEELRQYLGQMRGAPVGQIVAEVVSALLNGAQVKLGRRDGRLLLDLAAIVGDTAAPHLEEQFNAQVRDVLTQLRLAQVEAESELAEARQQGHEEPNDLDQPAGTSPAGTTDAPTAGTPSAGAPSAPSSGPGGARPGQAPQQSPQQAQQERGSAASRLWTPGQG